MSGARYADFLRQTAAEERVQEGETWRSRTELELQSLWFSGQFGREFQDEEGRSIRLIQAGFWNRESGPDFEHAAIEVEGERRVGAIEVDKVARDWEHHGHGVNPAFEEVVLHVFFGRTEGPRFFTRTRSHREVPQLCLSELPSAGEKGWAAEALPGRCVRSLEALSEKALEELLRSAAQFRAENKARRFLRTATLQGEEQAWFEALAESLGYAANAVPLRILAQRCPLALLREEPASVEARLYGEAGFLDLEGYERARGETRAYLRGLWEEWWSRREEAARRLRLPWALRGSRPANHPHRRIAALALVAGAWSEWRGLWSTEAPREVARKLGALEHEFWSHHFTLSAQAFSRPTALIGPARARDFLGNFLLPVRWVRQEIAWSEMEQLPPASLSKPLRRVAVRLFGSAEKARSWDRRFWQQQALLQIYQDFCLQDASGCARCAFPEQAAGWGSL